jgi:hypothetical protein
MDGSSSFGTSAGVNVLLNATAFESSPPDASNRWSAVAASGDRFVD